jgi:hypothetical protein
MYENGIRALLRIVSMREVAVTMCEEPAVSDVKRYRFVSSSHDFRDSAMVVVAMYELGAVLINASREVKGWYRYLREVAAGGER